MESKTSPPVISIGYIVAVLVFVSVIVTTFTEIGIEMGGEIAMLFYTAMAVLSFYLLLRLVVAVKKIAG